MVNAAATQNHGELTREDPLVSALVWAAAEPFVGLEGSVAELGHGSASQRLPKYVHRLSAATTPGMWPSDLPGGLVTGNRVLVVLEAYFSGQAQMPDFPK
jgi:hypothetical protein